MHDDQGFWHLITSVPPAIQGALMAFGVSVLRALYDDKEPKVVRILLEGLICGGVTLSASSLISWLSWPENLAVFVGGTLGFIGVQQVRKLLLKFLNIQIQK